MRKLTAKQLGEIAAEATPWLTPTKETLELIRSCVMHEDLLQAALMLEEVCFVRPIHTARTYRNIAHAKGFMR